MAAVLTFSDEFDGFQAWNGTTGWQTTQWYAPPGGMHPWNNELQWYVDPNYDCDGDGTTADTPNPFSTSNGVLNITARPTDPEFQPYIQGYKYTSGMITTYGSFSQQYGYFEMRAQLPAGQGLWPAFWMLPANGAWPPELDIMEVLGHDTKTLYTTVHSNSTGSITSKSKATVVPDLSAGFHTYGVDWQKDKITWYFDGQPIYQVDTPPDMHTPMYLQANLAVGGDWPGSPDATTNFPATMSIDYIRAWTSRPEDVQALFELPDSQQPTSQFIGGKKADKLTGTAGNDLLNGGAGADTMTGGAGDDTYVVDNGKDVVVEKALGGIDTVRTSLGTYVLGANVENLILTGTSSQTGRGNELDNKIVANHVGSTLDGGFGNDILVGGKGADTLIGGWGQDIFVFDKLYSTTDRIADFTPGLDMIDMRGLFASIGYTGSDPIASGHLKLLANSFGGTDLFVDRDGSGTAYGAMKVVTIDKALPGQLQAQGDWWFA